jgi:phytoene dehydrogenase-like protein
MWRASLPVLTGPPPWPPLRHAARPDPRALLAVRPWLTLRAFARARARDPRLRLIIERAATYAGADPRRAPAALALAGYVEHAFGGWHVRGGIHAIIRELVARLERAGARIDYATRAASLARGGGRASGVVTAAGERIGADWVLWNGDAEALSPTGRERSLSGYVLLIAARSAPPGLHHHTIVFPADYDAEFDDLFVHRRPAREPTAYLSVSSVSDPSQAPPGAANAFVLVNAPAGAADGAFDGYHRIVLRRLACAGYDLTRAEVVGKRTPATLERDTGAVGGAIYGAAPHGRLGTLRRPGLRVRGLRNVLRVGGTAHPGGGLPLVALSGELAARTVGPA